MELDNYKFSIKTQVKIGRKWCYLSYVDFFEETVTTRGDNKQFSWNEVKDIREK